jgi:hypothetical protein
MSAHMVGVPGTCTPYCPRCEGTWAGSGTPHSQVCSLRLNAVLLEETDPTSSELDEIRLLNTVPLVRVLARTMPGPDIARNDKRRDIMLSCLYRVPHR